MSFFFTGEPIELFPQPLLGDVEQTITQSHPGRIKFQATTWPARFYEATCQAIAHPHDRVTIIGMQGITLLVRAG